MLLKECRFLDLVERPYHQWNRGDFRDTLAQSKDGLHVCSSPAQRCKWVAIDADYRNAMEDLLKLQYHLSCKRGWRNPDGSCFIAELRKKRPHYLAFLSFPESIRRSFSTTNVVEAINGQLEILRRNSGGYFYSEDTLKLKLGLAISSLEEGRWRSPGRTTSAVLHQLNAMFQSRFEANV